MAEFPEYIDIEVVVAQELADFLVRLDLCRSLLEEEVEIALAILLDQLQQGLIKLLLKSPQGNGLLPCIQVDPPPLPINVGKHIVYACGLLLGQGAFDEIL